MSSLLQQVTDQIHILESNIVVHSITDVVIKDKEFRDKLSEIISSMTEKNVQFDIVTLLPIITLILETINNHEDIINDFSTIVSGDTVKLILYNVLVDWKLIDTDVMSYEKMEMFIDLSISLINNNIVFKKIKTNCCGCLGKKKAKKTIKQTSTK